MFHSVFSLRLYIHDDASPICLETHFNGLTMNYYTLYKMIFFTIVEQ
jgi:hypothetical protein